MFRKMRRFKLELSPESMTGYFYSRNYKIQK